MPTKKCGVWRLLSRSCDKKRPEACLSVDTFRAEVAQYCVRDYGVNLINDISGGTLDRAMFHTVARLGVPYILMHLQGTPRTMQDNPHYDDPVAEVIEWLARRVQRLRELGAHDLILDPGFASARHSNITTPCSTNSNTSTSSNCHFWSV